MKLLLDSCIGRSAVHYLRSKGLEVVWAVEWGRDSGDKEMLRYAFENDAVLVTLDKDFGELAIVYGVLHAGIIRLTGIKSSEQGPFCKRILEKHPVDLKNRAIITASPDRIRIRLPED